MAEPTQTYSVFEQPGRDHKALQAKAFDTRAFLLVGIWAISQQLWLTGASLLVLEALLIVALISWGWAFILPLAFIHFYCGFNAYNLLARDLKNDGFANLGEVQADSDITATSRVKSGQLTPEQAPIVFDPVPDPLKPIFAVAHLTWQAAFRYKFFWLMAALLLLAVVALPLILQDDGTPKSLIHILITYTLAMITLLLGVSSLWLGCGTLARDVEECQMQMVATKPIPRWQIWLGKWLGIMSLNAALLGLAGAAVYGMVQYRLDRFSETRFEALKHEPLNTIAPLAWDSGLWTNRITDLPEWALSDVCDMILDLEGEKGNAKRKAELDDMASKQASKPPPKNPPLNIQFWHSMWAGRRDNPDPKYPDGFSDDLRQLIARLEVDKARRKYLVGRASVKPILEDNDPAKDYYKRAERSGWRAFISRVRSEQPDAFASTGIRPDMNIEETIDILMKSDDVAAKFLSTIKENAPADIEIFEWYDNAQKEGKAWMEAVPVSITRRDPNEGLRTTYRSQSWNFSLPGARDLPEDATITLRFKLEVFANSAREQMRDAVNINLKNRVFPAQIEIGDQSNPNRQVILEDMTIRTFHEFDVMPSSFTEQGDLTFKMVNFGGRPSFQTGEPTPQVSLSIPFWNGEMEILYTESSFGENYVRGLLVLFCWLGLLAGLGLAFASFMSFPMATFTCVGLLIIAFSTPLMRDIIEDDTIIQGYTQDLEGNVKDTSILDWYAIPAFKLMTTMISPLTDYSPVQDLSEGRSITWGMLFKAYAFVWGVGCLFAFGGMLILTKRELALAGNE